MFSWPMRPIAHAFDQTTREQRPDTLSPMSAAPCSPHGRAAYVIRTSMIYVAAKVAGLIGDVREKLDVPRANGVRFPHCYERALRAAGRTLSVSHFSSTGFRVDRCGPDR